MKLDGFVHDENAEASRLHSKPATPTRSVPARVKVVGWKRVKEPWERTAPLLSTADTIIVSGGVVSLTVMWNVADAVLPCESCAVHVTVVVPSGKVDPVVGEHGAGSGPSTESVAVASGNLTCAPFGPVASTVMSEGVTTMGGVVS